MAHEDNGRPKLEEEARKVYRQANLDMWLKAAFKYIGDKFKKTPRYAQGKEISKRHSQEDIAHIIELANRESISNMLACKEKSGYMKMSHLLTLCDYLELELCEIPVPGIAERRRCSFKATMQWHADAQEPPTDTEYVLIRTVNKNWNAWIKAQIAGGPALDQFAQQILDSVRTMLDEDYTLTGEELSKIITRWQDSWKFCEFALETLHMASPKKEDALK